MLTKTKKLIECNSTHSALREAKSLGKDANGRSRYEVVILTEGKGNPRDRHYYSQACINDPVTREAFQGKPCFLNHPSTLDDQIQPERRVQDRAGWFTNVHADGVALKATLTISKTETGEFLEAFIQDCLDYSLENVGEDYAGLSINANGESSPVDLNGEEWNQVDRITEAESVDAVTKAARGGRFEKKLEAFRKKRETDADKMTQACGIVKELRDKIQAAGEFPLQKELRRMSDNLLTVLGTSQEGETMKKKKSEQKILEEANKAARGAAHAALTGLAAQAGDDATKKILMDHASQYAPKDGDGEPDGDEGKTESEDEDEDMKKEAEAKKEKEAKKGKEAEDEDEKESEDDEDEKESEAKKEAKMEALRKENFELKLEKMLKESELPEPFQKSVRAQAEGKSIKQIEAIIESESEKVEYFNLRESGAPALNRGTSKHNSSGPVLAGFLDEK